MQGFLWLLLQMSLLLLAAAIVFFWLGWRWRGQIAHGRIADLNAQIDAESRTAQSARQERESAQSAVDELKSSQLRESADLLEAQERQRTLEREILRLSDELKAARHQLPKPPETATATASEAAILEVAAKTAPAIKELRVRKPTAPPAKRARMVNGRNVLKRLEKNLAMQAALVETLRAKHAEDEGRLDILKMQKNRAAIRAATKGLAQSQRNLAEAVQALESRQRQIRAITHSLATAVKGAEEDDLTQIKGIKGAINDQLRSLGTRTYRQIAHWSDEEALAFGELLAIKRNATRDVWRAQARELHAAKHGAEPG